MKEGIMSSQRPYIKIDYRVGLPYNVYCDGLAYYLILKWS